MWIWLQVTSTVPPGAAHAAVSDDSPALLKKLSLIRTFRCHPVPRRCGDQVEYRVNGPMCVGLSSRQSLKMSGKYGCTVRTPSPAARWVLKKRIKSCHHEVWMHLSHANPRGDRAAQYKHAQRVHLKERTSPYDHSTQRSRAHREQSDHSRNA